MVKDTYSETNCMKRVLIMAGGTGGHVFPGLAVAKHLRAIGVEVHWLGTKQGIESRVVPEANIPLHFVTISGLRGKGVKALLLAPFTLLAAVRQSQRIIKMINPDAVIGLGGFVSGPGGIASWLMRRPLVIHEQNAKAGLTNKMLAHLSRRVLQGFPGAFKSQSKVISIGNPVRHEIENLPPPSARHHLSQQPCRLLVLGGSLGAKALNEMVPRALAQLKADERPEVWHQTGEKHFEETKNIYNSMGLQANVTPFIEDMADAYAWANMVLCRAGASTVAELCAVGLGAILVPYPYAVDDHQTANADFMTKQGAAICVQQAALTESRLAELIKQFSQSAEKRFAMAEAAYRLRQVNVAEMFYGILCNIVKGG